MYTVITVPAFTDNYIWLIRHENHCLVVDPGDAGPVLDRLAALDLQLDAILLTHHHQDHVGGVTALLVSVAFASSLGMSLPISTPPNALAYATGLVSSRGMAISGVILGILGMILTYVMMMILAQCHAF